jgi:phospholipid transport system substrate-binding protein
MKKLLSIVLISVFMAAAAPAACMASTPTETVKTTIDKVVSVLQNPAMKGSKKEQERRAAIRKAVFNVFDFREMAMRSLAKNWKPLSAKDKDEFSSLYADLLERSYINRIESYSGEKVVYDGESLDGDYAVVKTKFVTARREEILVDYKLMKKDGGWWVYDLVIERVSLVNNYRIQFNKIIRSSSYAELVKKMKDKKESELLSNAGS